MRHRIGLHNSIDLALIIVSYFALENSARYINSFGRNLLLGPFSITQSLFLGIVIVCLGDILNNLIFFGRYPKDKFHLKTLQARHGQWAHTNRKLQSRFQSKSSLTNQDFWKNAEQTYLQLIEKYPLPTESKTKILATTIETTPSNSLNSPETRLIINPARPETGKDLMPLTLYNQRSFIITGLMVLIMIGVWVITTYIPVSP